MIRTNSKSCVMDSFAEVTGIPVTRFIEEMGTDGSEYGVPTQLIVDSLLEAGFAITPIERNPRRQDPLSGSVGDVYSPTDALKRWDWHLSQSVGVLYGYRHDSGLPHAMPWHGHKQSVDATRIMNPYLLWKVTSIA